MERSELEIPEFPIYQDLELFKVEWLIMGALLFVAVVAWSEFLLHTISILLTGESDGDPYVRFIYAMIITGITIFAVFLFERRQKDRV